MIGWVVMVGEFFFWLLLLLLFFFFGCFQLESLGENVLFFGLFGFNLVVVKLIPLMPQEGWKEAIFSLRGIGSATFPSNFQVRGVASKSGVLLPSPGCCFQVRGVAFRKGKHFRIEFEYLLQVTRVTPPKTNMTMENPP